MGLPDEFENITIKVYIICQLENLPYSLTCN